MYAITFQFAKCGELESTLYRIERQNGGEFPTYESALIALFSHLNG